METKNDIFKEFFGMEDEYEMLQKKSKVSHLSFPLIALGRLRKKSRSGARRKRCRKCAGACTSSRRATRSRRLV